MKRVGNLWPLIVSFDNLFAASCSAQKSKRFRDNVLKFNYNLEAELFKLRKELTDRTYRPGQYKTFHVSRPKPRMISAAPYRDRVVHHALCNVIGPILDKSFIFDTYANRENFGSHKALRRFTEFLRTSRYVLKCDITKYYPSIDHALLLEDLAKKIKCKDTLRLCETIIDSSHTDEHTHDYYIGDDLFTPVYRKKGLPIGNLTSQLFANFYLSSLDHYAKEVLRIKKYLRYCDDFALFSDEKNELVDALTMIGQFLDTRRLSLHPKKSQIHRCVIGAEFVGFRVFPDRIRVRASTISNARKRIRLIEKRYRDGKVDTGFICASIQSWFAHLQHADTYRLRECITKDMVFLRQ